ncbi:hypothetical protein HS7_13260 [Sulfolobales archaeon HS-7]|nr:hypothetical protein HS7_13260 [Sulfolobales archaeon HS-7]
MDERKSEIIELLKSKALNNSVRVAIITILYYSGSLSFSRLLELLQIPKSSLEFHIKLLEEEQLINVKDVIRPSRPGVSISLTEKGRETFKKLSEFMGGGNGRE